MQTNAVKTLVATIVLAFLISQSPGGSGVRAPQSPPQTSTVQALCRLHNGARPQTLRSYNVCMSCIVDALSAAEAVHAAARSFGLQSPGLAEFLFIQHGVPVRVAITAAHGASREELAFLMCEAAVRR